jgi:hypothetical protein
MLTGAVAMMKYSVYRYTADIDMILELESKDAKRIFRRSNRIIMFRTTPSVALFPRKECLMSFITKPRLK